MEALKNIGTQISNTKTGSAIGGVGAFYIANKMGGGVVMSILTGLVGVALGSTIQTVFTQHEKIEKETASEKTSGFGVKGIELINEDLRKKK